MQERVVIITGANSGIGKASAFRFAEEGYTVIMACRNVKVSRPVQQEIVESTNNARVELLELDVSCLSSIQSFCEEFQSRFEKLDILIHNAAYFNHGASYQVSVDGVELTFATNVVGPYYLTHLLLDHLKKSDDPRILHAGSNIIKHFFDPKKSIDFSNLQGENNDPKFSVYKMYCQSKMALMMLTFKQAEEFKNAGIKVNALQINGAKMSKETLMKVTPGYRVVARLQNLFFRPTTYMADKYYEICTSERFRDVTGKLFNDELELMEPASETPKGILQDVKQLVGKSLYPAYAKNDTVINQVYELCRELTVMKGDVRIG
ncbi:SDR family oxidoreductase [Anaerobacillus alkaliphilus]|uniref:SDR family oxidoreductase n=1 Tax=Anaerobacillus alkaliphilus TaxID=1548597 RepID=A0A4Q0VP11_9BACI|nr:SDR family oxidoreductase [Anaerobacillus alkaliphilus]RXI96592.1 SDR family oxidoreductase [Anaerobacillus alkaliphilus]